MKSSWRTQVYRALQTRLGSALLPRWMSPARLAEARRHAVESAGIAPATAGSRRAWFHAASVGELESLIPLIEAWLARGADAVVTVFSESARSTLRRLAAEQERLGSAGRGRILFAGYSPWEGAWGRALDAAGVGVFVSAKYEAWPELWGSLGERSIPLVIVGARARRSLKAALGLCRAMAMRLPRIRLLAVLPEEAQALRDLFGRRAEVSVIGDPRWDRVHDRAQRGSPRATELTRLCASLPRPWGVLGQVWPEDLALWRGSFSRGAATLWIVPHRVDAESVAEIEKDLARAGLRWARTSTLRTPPEAGAFLLVDELGVLSELYAAADWAYVGGGFGEGIHSTIEPALYGLPVSCGPEGTALFSEVRELASVGQLTVVEDSEALSQWLGRVAQSRDRRATWALQAKARLGATTQALALLENLAAGPAGRNAPK